MGPKFNHWCSYKKSHKENTWEEDGHVRTEAETGAMPSEAKECQGLPAATSSQEAWKDSSGEPQREHGPAVGNEHTQLHVMVLLAAGILFVSCSSSWCKGSLAWVIFCGCSEDQQPLMVQGLPWDSRP